MSLAPPVNWEELKAGEWHPYYLVQNLIIRFQLWENVVDWTEVLQNAKVSIAQGVDPAPLLPQSSINHLTSSLARMLDISEASSILVNVQLAALYLRHLLQVFLHIHSISPSYFLLGNLPGKS
jgi:hypothetical protein